MVGWGGGWGGRGRPVTVLRESGSPDKACEPCSQHAIITPRRWPAAVPPAPPRDSPPAHLHLEAQRLVGRQFRFDGVDLIRQEINVGAAHGKARVLRYLGGAARRRYGKQQCMPMPTCREGRGVRRPWKTAAGAVAAGPQLQRHAAGGASAPAAPHLLVEQVPVHGVVHVEHCGQRGARPGGRGQVRQQGVSIECLTSSQAACVRASQLWLRLLLTAGARRAAWLEPFQSVSHAPDAQLPVSAPAQPAPRPPPKPSSPLTVVVGRHRRLCLLAAHVDATHGGAQLARGAPHLARAGGLGQRPGNDLEDAGVVAAGGGGEVELGGGEGEGRGAA